jgi:uncharacterized protein (TIRG00374 family)
LFLSFLLCSVNVFITNTRWYILVRAQQLPFSIRNAIRISLIGYFFNQFLPSSVGGDLVKAAFIAREQSRRTVAVSTVLMDRIVGLWGLIAVIALLGSTYYILDPEFVNSKPTLIVTIGGAIGFLIVSIIVWLLLGYLPEQRVERFSGRLLQIPRIGGVLRELWRAVWMYRSQTASIVKAVLLSWLSHVCWVLMYYFAVQAFQPTGAAMPTLANHFLIVPMGMIAQGFIPLPGGIGGGEFVFGKLYSLLGYPESSGILGSLGWRICACTIGLLGYVVYRFMKKDLAPVMATETTVNTSAPAVTVNS